MAPQFGTSGLRGLVTELTQKFVQDYARAFLSACETGDALYVGRDLRPSSPQIANWIIEEAQNTGLDVYDCGAVPTPALALAARGQSAIMVTGSHIPADRNGLKFYVPQGEISKSDEQAILAALGSAAPTGTRGTIQIFDAARAFEQRYVNAFGTKALQGLRIGIYEHSSVARDLLMALMAKLGATPISIARSETFIPVDTEALDPETTALFARWIATHELDVLISTDGDADRPMLAGRDARVIPGDVLGALSARALKAEIICTPVSSNSQVDGMFDQVQRTKIGSPHVIAAMDTALRDNAAAKVVGYEANGGFLLGFEAPTQNGTLSPLMTRDCLLPIIAPLAVGQASALSITDLAAHLPARFTAADRLQGIAPEHSAPFLQNLREKEAERSTFFGNVDPVQSIDHTDGLRVTLQSGDIVHLRPSGNAPEFRCYTEASSAQHAAELCAIYLDKLSNALN